MSQPLDRTHACDELGPVDRESGEFWVRNPFQMPQLGHNLSAYEPNRLFLNVEGKWFIDASFASQANLDSDSRSVVAADFNNDGAIDLLVGSVGGGPLRLLLNRISTDHHRVRLDLRGISSNRSAVGAQVVLQCGSTRITRELFPANGFMGQSPAELIIGVGAATEIDELTVRWPSGLAQSFTKLPVDRRLQITEGEPDAHSLSF